jgi:hypothetical protein
MEKNRLIILSQYFPPEMGAPQSRLWETAIGLKNRGWDLRIVTAMPNYPTGKVFKSHRNRFHFSELVNGVMVWRYWLYASNSKYAMPTAEVLNDIDRETLKKGFGVPVVNEYGTA